METQTNVGEGQADRGLAKPVHEGQDSEPVGLMQLLEAETAPVSDRVVLYGVDPDDSGFTAVHDFACTKTGGGWHGHPQAYARKTTGKLLLQALKNDDVQTACGQTCHRQRFHVQLLLNNDMPVEPGVVGWAHYATLLYYELWKPQNVEDWCQWACGKTPEQIRCESRAAINWDSHLGQQPVACFDVNGCSKNGWAIGAGDHVSVKRPQEYTTVKVHGLLPENLVAQHGSELASGLIVPVAKTFTKTHLELAVNLYETATENGRKTGQRVRQKAAEHAVETAQLVLA